MYLTYPTEAETFRAEIRAWLEENLPKGWFEPGFKMTEAQRREFNESWTPKLFAGGWICASWPKEYGGKGLSLMEQVVLNEEFAKAGTVAKIPAPPAGKRFAIDRNAVKVTLADQ